MENILEKVEAVSRQLEEIQDEMCKIYKPLKDEEKLSHSGMEMIAISAALSLLQNALKGVNATVLYIIQNTLEVVTDENTTRQT